nr:reverse transcriptase domain-containing protein [Tanacetum cinerariifolium]
DAIEDGMFELNKVHTDDNASDMLTKAVAREKLKISEKLHQEKAQQEKLKAVKAHLNFEEASQYSDSETPNKRRNLKERLGPRDARTRSRSPKQRHGRSKSPREKGPERRTVFKRLEKGMFHRLGDKEKNVSAHSRGTKRKSYYSSRRDTESCYQSSRSKETEIASEKHRHKKEYSRRTEAVSESEGSAGGDWKSKPKKQKSSMDDDLSQPWAMPTWCHMFNSTLTGNAMVWFDDLHKESIDRYDDLRKAFMENYLQQKKCIKDPVEIHNIKQRNRESMEEFVKRYKLECRDVKGALECMKISGFMHGITNPELIKRLHDKIPKSMDEMMSVIASFLKGEMAASNRERKKSFTLLTKTPREIIALDKGKFKPPPPMTTPVEKRNASKFCEFHGEVSHTTDECMHLKRQIEEILKAGKLSHLIKELKQNYEKDQTKIAKKGEPSGKDKPLAILMVQPWQKIARQRITQTFSTKLVISFPTLGEEDGTEGPMIIEGEMEGHCVHRIYVDRGSPLKILYEHCFSKFLPEIKNQLIPANTPLVVFSGEIIWPLGQISLLVRIGDEEHSTSARMNFMVVRSPYPYNRILGRPGVRKIRAIPSTAHEMINFPVGGGIVTLQSSMIIPLECSMVSEPGEGRKELCGLLRRHLDVFAWKPTDMTGVPRHIVEHRLNVREGCLPVRQKKRGQAPERNKAISEKVEKLVEADIMKEVHYHSWLSNPVMVKKHDDSWRMCGDFKDLNKACPKDGYPLPKIDLMMPFGLKNAGATYQRLVDMAFQKQIGRNLEVYVDDLVIKSRTEKEVIKDAEETFKTLRKINMKLNPKKCAFGMREGTFLGYKVDADRLRGSPDKVKAVLNLPSPKCLKDVQKLNEKLASLNRFLSKSPKKSLPFFKTLKKCIKNSDFQWTSEAEGAFKEMKQSIAELPIAVLMTERDGKQVPIYFVSRALQGPEINYTPMEKLILVLYRPRTSVKGQILADFIVERPEDGTPDTPMEDREELPDPWILFTNGSSCVDGSGAGLIIMNPEGMEFTYALRFRFNATNNEADYEALIAGLRIAS